MQNGISHCEVPFFLFYCDSGDSNEEIFILRLEEESLDRELCCGVEIEIVLRFRKCFRSRGGCRNGLAKVAGKGMDWL